jgi:hypothetical protein
VIQAPPEAAGRLVTDAAGQPGWNRTLTRVDGVVALGGTTTAHARVAPGRAFPVKVVALDAPRRRVWRGGIPPGLFKGERVFESAFDEFAACPKARAEGR